MDTPVNTPADQQIQAEIERIEPEVEDRASESDRLWFYVHPDRSYRIRPRLPGELAGGGDHILVYQVTRGVRIRRPVRFTMPCTVDDDVRIQRIAEITARGGAVVVCQG